MAPTRIEAVLLQSIDYGDTSRIYRLFTPDFGLQSVISKGVRRPRHPLTGVLETLNHIEAVYYRRPNRSLFTLSQATAIETFPGLSTDIQRYYRASAIAEMLLRLGTEEEKSRELFRVLVRSLRAVSRRPVDTLDGWMFASAWEILDILGYGPRMAACVRCDAPAEGAGVAPGSFSVEEGGVLCARCANASSGQGIDLPAGVRAVIGGARGREGRMALLPGEAETLLRVTDDYIQYHVAGRRLASWAFLRALRS